MNQAVILDQGFNTHKGGRLQEAMKFYREVLAQNAAHVEANYGIGRVYRVRAIHRGVSQLQGGH